MNKNVNNHDSMPGNGHKYDRSLSLKWSRIILYFSISAILLIGIYCVHETQWNHGVELHLAIEMASVLLALIIGILALLMYYTKKDPSFLLVGSGFLGTSLLDGYHVIISIFFFSDFYQIDQHNVFWTWNFSRIFLSVALFLSWVFWALEKKKGQKYHFNSKWVYCFKGLILIVCFCFLSLIHLVSIDFPSMVFRRSVELISAFFFLCALIGYLHKGDWRHRTFDHWVVLSLIISFCVQALYIIRSGSLLDSMYFAGHLLKLTSYFSVLVGMFISIFSLFKIAETANHHMRKLNMNLNKENLERKKIEAELSIVVEAVPNGLIIVDQQGHIVFVNSQTEKFFGYSREELVGKPIYLLVPQQFRSNHTQHLESYLPDPQARPMGAGRDLYGLHKNGHEFPVEIGLSPIKTETGLLVLASIINIQERKKLDEALRSKNEELERYNKAFTGREQKIIELKREINNLLQLLGKPARFSRDYLDEE